MLLLKTPVPSPNLMPEWLWIHNMSLLIKKIMKIIPGALVVRLVASWVAWWPEDPSNTCSIMVFAWLRGRTIRTVKRFKEPKAERRPWRIWFYDTSKQAIGALFIHFANVFLSDLTEEDPCSLYLINFILDATLGMLLIWLGVKVVSWIVHHKKYTYLVFGEYGDPPQAAAWIGQCILYLLIMVFEKTVISLVLLIPGWTKLQQILLGYIPNPQLELVLVMLVVPFIVNSIHVTFLLKAIMFWVVDSLIMRKYKQKDTLDINGSIETPRVRRTEESQVLLSPDMDFDQSESDQDISGLQGTNQKMKQPSYQVVI
ncbi:Store-operated calcium entry regulator STIMATE [Willisornis vidua]|uniref:Store-operated calcium entry regulator STIMATE n=1 Tax=Willisornis vidua TaxID=1566151 RepID=A0ABQ9CPY5_9PASS|nr:Store-operated calcium entry regulator STIMATE [Willisornis vidua]